MTCADAANVRLRARKAALLGPGDLDDLVGRDVPAILAALGQTPYRPDVEAALARRGSGLACLLDVLRGHLARTLREVRALYAGDSRVDLLLLRWDVRNLVVALRAAAGQVDPDDALSLLVPAGRLSEGALRELLRRPGLRAAVDLLASWLLPTPEVAHAPVLAWPRYERQGTLAVLEQALAAAYRRAVARALDADDEADAPLRDVLLAEAEAAGVVTLARQIAARERGEEAGSRAAAGEEASAADEEVLAAGSREDAAAALARRGARRGAAWTEAVAAWGRDGDAPALEERLRAAVHDRAVSLFLRGDPASVAPAVAFAFAKEREVERLRLIGTASARGVPDALVRAHLAGLARGGPPRRGGREARWPASSS